MFRIGYVDEDPKEAQKIERNLREYFEVITYDIQKGLPKQDLLEQIYSSEIDLLMVDYLMKDRGILAYNGDEVVRDYEEIKPDFPMIIFTHNENQAFPQMDDVNIIYDKKILNEDKEHFVEIIKKNILIYQKYIEKRKKQIENLLIKRETEEGLNAKEKDDLFRLQLELNRLDPRMHEETPSQLLSDMNLDHLADVTRDAQELLKILTNNSDKNINKH